MCIILDVLGCGINFTSCECKKPLQDAEHSWEDQLKFDNKDKDDETWAKIASLEARAVVENDVVMTEKKLADSKASFESAEPNCMQLSQDHEASHSVQT